MAMPAIIDPDRYAARGYPHDIWTRLRREAPVARVEPPGRKPFYAVTRHADVIRVSRDPARFRNAPRLLINPEVTRSEVHAEERHLLRMDPPEHRRYRRLVSGWFTPRALQRNVPRVRAIARDVIDRIAAGRREHTGDFVAEVAAVVPIAVIADLLGVPEADRPLLFRFTNETIGAGDPEFQAGRSAAATLDRGRRALYEYFEALGAERRARPRDDLTSLLARASLDGQPLPTLELLSYYLLLVNAGNETTRNATSGGLLALIEHPGELQRLLRDPARLLPPAIEEILRFTSPVAHFCRTAATDVTLAGVRVRAGESLALFYPSANRDAAVFDAPFRFRVDRTPNPHLAFGIGEHFCLGAHLARIELDAVLRELVARLEDAELTAPVDRLRSIIVNGIKRLPVRLRFRATPARV